MLFQLLLFYKNFFHSLKIIYFTKMIGFGWQSVIIHLVDFPSFFYF